jgi:hypothetical protein
VAGQAGAGVDGLGAVADLRAGTRQDLGTDGSGRSLGLSSVMT